MSRFVSVLTVLALVGSTLCAQAPNPGDWIVGDLGYNGTHGGVYKIDPATGLLSTVAVGGGLNAVTNWVTMGEDNSGLVGLRASDCCTVPGNFLRISPAGTISDLGYVANNPNGMDLDQDGTWRVSAGGGAGGLCGLFRVSPLPLITTQITTCANGILNNTCIDQENGDTMFVAYSTGRVVRVNRVTGVQTIVASLLGSLSCIDFEPQTGHFILSRFGSSSLRRLNRTTNITSVIPSLAPYASNVAAVKVNDENGRLHVATLPGTFTTCSVGVLDPTSGAALQSFGFPSSITPTSVEVYGSRKVSGFGAATANSTYTLRFSFPSSPNAAYVAALTTSATAPGSGLRPGLALGDGTGRVVNLNIADPLFVLSAGGIPGVTTGFSGALDAHGRATGTIQIPAGATGIRVFVSAVAVNPAMPSSLDTANTWAFTIN